MSELLSDYYSYWALGLVAGGIVLCAIVRVSGNCMFSKIYIRRSRLLTESEIRSYRRINQSVAIKGFQLMAQVRIADVILVGGRRNSKWWKAFRKISSKHVDFVVVDRDFNILCAIEIDDSSHSEKSRTIRDKFLDRVFQQAGVPLFRCPPGGEAHVIERILNV